MKIWDIDQKYRQRDGILFASDGEVTEDSNSIEREIEQDTAPALEAELLIAHELDAEAAMWRGQKELCAAKEKAANEGADKRRAHVERFMLAHQIEALALPHFPKLGFRKLPDVCEVQDGVEFTIEDAWKFPAMLKTITKITPDKKAIKAAWDRLVEDPYSGLAVRRELPRGITVITNRSGLAGHTIKTGKEE